MKISRELNQSSSSGSSWNIQEFSGLIVADEEEEVDQQPIEEEPEVEEEESKTIFVGI